APTLILAPVAPVDHCSVPPAHPLAVNIAFSSPHRTDFEGVITGVCGLLPSFTSSTSDISEEPQAFLQIAVYVPDATITGEPVIPLLQVSTPPVGQEPVKVAFSVPQTISLFVRTVGLVG